MSHSSVLVESSLCYIATRRYIDMLFKSQQIFNSRDRENIIND